MAVVMAAGKVQLTDQSPKEDGLMLPYY